MNSTTYGYRHSWTPGPKLMDHNQLRVVVPLRLPRHMAERVDTAASNRTRFIERAVSDALEVAEFDIFAELRNTKSS